MYFFSPNVKCCTISFSKIIAIFVIFFAIWSHCHKTSELYTGKLLDLGTKFLDLFGHHPAFVFLSTAVYLTQNIGHDTPLFRLPVNLLDQPYAVNRFDKSDPADKVFDLVGLKRSDKMNGKI